MTRVTFFKRSDGAILGFTAEGHADWAEYGQDIVCAAISALTQSTAMGVTEVVGAKAKVEQKSGHLSVTLDDSESEETLQCAQYLLRTLEKALYGIAGDARYPGVLRVNVRERRQKHA